MRWLKYIPVFLSIVLFSPSVAQAHLVTTGLGPFYDGALHLALSPDDLLGLISVALLAGLCGAKSGRWMVAVLPIAWLLGAVIGLNLTAFPELPGLSILSFVILGLLVALDVKLPVWGVAALAGSFGILHGLLNGAALQEAPERVLNVLGILSTVFVLSLLLSAAVVSLRPLWTRVVVRVAGSWVVAVGMLMFGWLYRGSVALVLMISLALAGNAVACFVCRVPYQSQLDKVESSAQVIIARASEEVLADWQIVRVLKSNDNLDRIGAVENSLLFRPGSMHLLRRATADDPWTILDTVDQEHITFLTGSLELLSKQPVATTGKGQRQSLAWFLPYLNHENPVLADSAFHKILNAPYNDVRKLGRHLDPTFLLELLDASQLDSKRRSLYITLLGTCGGKHESVLLKQWIDDRWKNGSSGDLAALLAAHAELNGEQTVQFIEDSYLRNHDRKLDELIEAVAALSLHGQADGQIPRARITASYHLFLEERPPLLEMIIEDCAKWEDWSFAPKVIELYESGTQPWNNKTILTYLRACPLNAAQDFVQAQLHADDTQNVTITPPSSP